MIEHTGGADTQLITLEMTATQTQVGVLHLQNQSLMEGAMIPWRTNLTRYVCRFADVSALSSI
jgi:hypothetical protein